MPTKSPSSSMNQSPLQTKIGDASLKFGPDWLRALSSDSSTGGTGGTTGAGSGPSGGGWASGSGGGGSSGERDRERTSVERSPGSYHHPSAGRDREKEPDRHRYSNHNNSSNANHSTGPAVPLLTNRFKASEFRYSREEILTLYDKNLQAPDYLTKFGTLFVEKMQPPLAFSVPTEDELRTWHVTQPESSRPTGGGGPVGGSLTSPLSRGGGFTPRGRGIERGRGGGRGGRGGYYGRPHEEEDPRFRQQNPFSRSLSAHERSWVPDRERNGLSGSPPEAENSRGGGAGNWRNRNSDSYSKSGGGRFDEADDGWRSKPRWRRDEDEEYTPPRSNTRRQVHKSWSDDGTQDLPEWAKDNPSEESGTFDASGAFHDEDRYSAKTNAFELSRRSEGGDQRKDGGKDDFRSQHNRVQKKAEREVVSHPIKEQEEEMMLENRSKTKKSKSPPESPTPPTLPSREDSTPEKDRPVAAEVKRSNAHESLPSQKQINDPTKDQYRSLSENADSLVAKLIEDDAVIVRHGRDPSLPPAVSSIPNTSAGVTSNAPVVQQLCTPPPLVPPPPMGSPDVWFYRDPQGNVQGPFVSTEMSLWLTQGYFSGGLYLRRECDKIFITLSEMGKLYGRNPFVPATQPDSITPPPLQDANNGTGTSALDPLMVEAIHPGHPQFHQKQLYVQQQQQQYLINALQGGGRKDVDGWSGSANPVVNSATAAQLQQAQILLSNMVKAQQTGMGGGADGSSFDLQTLFQRHTQQQQQLKSQEKVGDYRNPNVTQIPTQQNDGISVDPIQSLLHQLTSMANTQNIGIKSSSGNGWGPTQPSGWNSQIPPPAPPTTAANPMWEYREQYMKLQQLKAEEEMMARKKKEEELERKRVQEEEEARKRLEDQKRLEIEQEQKRAYEEMLQQQQLAAAELARQREELAMQQRLQQQELARQRMEQERQLEKQREALQKIEQQRLEQQRLEQQRLEQARLEKEREEERDRERERERQEQERRIQAETEEQRRREEKRAQQEFQAKKLFELQLQQQQQQQKLPVWNTADAQAPRTLREIQEEEALQLERRKAEQLALKKRQEEEARERLREQQKGGLSLTWAQPLLPQQSVPIKSLAEIQAEEAATLEEKRRDVELKTRQHSLQQNWTPTMTWANRASLNAPPPPAPMTTTTGTGTAAQKISGVWEDRKKSWDPEVTLSPTAKTATVTVRAGGGPKDQEDSFLKLISDHGLSVGDGSGRKDKEESKEKEDPFTKWCYETVQQFAGTVDIPTFINFLKEVESPFEVNDYIRSYLGDSKEVREFGRQFLEKRSRWKNGRGGAGGKELKEDNLYRPASTANAPTAEFQEVKGKKGKKGKMQKVDARNLGFNTTSAPDRLNVGKRDYGDGTDN